MSKIRIGRITFTNILPVYHFFREEKFQNDVEFIAQVPSGLNQKMAKGEIDIGPMSAFAYGENQDLYELLPGLSISAKGKVRSIFLFSKKPLQHLDGAKIALTNTSASSVHFLKIILEKFLGIFPQYKMMEPRIGSMMIEADACLLIGDDALLAYWNNPGYLVYDLGELWYKNTGMWMTTAVWGVRKETLKERANTVRLILEEFLRSKKMGLSHLDEVITGMQSTFGGTHHFWKTYFSGLSYDFTEEHKKGLLYYFNCLHEMGFIEKPVTLSIWNPAQVLF